MLSGDFVAGFHVEEGKVGVHELFLGTQFLRFVAFGDGRLEIAETIVGHAERELGLEILRVLREDGLQLLRGRGKIALAEVEHGVVVVFLQCQCQVNVNR